MMAEHPLDADQLLSTRLRQLDRVWALDGVLAPELRPGLDPDETSMRLTALGLANPEKSLLDWFAWHDGTTTEDRTRSRAGASTWNLMRLDRAISRYQDLLAEATQWASIDSLPIEEAGWSRTWFPLLWNMSGDTLALELEGDASGSLVMVFNSGETIPHVAESLIVLVETWLEMYDTGRFAYADHEWTWNGHVGPELRDVRWLL